MCLPLIVMDSKSHPKMLRTASRGTAAHFVLVLYSRLLDSKSGVRFKPVPLAQPYCNLTGWCFLICEVTLYRKTPKPSGILQCRGASHIRKHHLQVRSQSLDISCKAPVSISLEGEHLGKEKDWQRWAPSQGRRPSAEMWRLLPSIDKAPEKTVLKL